MKRPLLPVFTLLVGISAQVMAQSQVVSPSARFLTMEGVYSGRYFGYYREGRTQLLDGNLRGSAKTIKEIALRPDGSRGYYSYNGTGRNWNRVTLQMAETDHVAPSKTFALNHKSNPTTVFRAAFSLPTLSGPQPNRPAPFSVRFPFATSWKYGGTRDVCADFTFVGGVLANAASFWNNNTGLAYALDTYGVGTHTTAGAASFGTACQDSGQTRPSVSLVESTTYGPQGFPFQNVHSINALAIRLGKDAPAVLALGVDIAPNGHALPGVNCGKLHLDPAKPMLLKFGRTDSFGAFGWWRSGLTIPIQASFFGLYFLNQAAWADTKTGELKLSDGARTEFSKLPSYVDDKTPRRHAVYSYRATSAIATSTSRDFEWNPILRYGM
jgi:hypothetical protein